MHHGVQGFLKRPWCFLAAGEKKRTSVASVIITSYRTFLTGCGMSLPSFPPPPHPGQDRAHGNAQVRLMEIIKVR